MHVFGRRENSHSLLLLPDTPLFLSVRRSSAAEAVLCATRPSDPEVLSDPGQEVGDSSVDPRVAGLGTAVAEGDDAQLHPAALFIVDQRTAGVPLPAAPQSATQG